MIAKKKDKLKGEPTFYAALSVERAEALALALIAPGALEWEVVQNETGSRPWSTSNTPADLYGRWFRGRVAEVISQENGENTIREWARQEADPNNEIEERSIRKLIEQSEKEYESKAETPEHKEKIERLRKKLQKSKTKAPQRAEENEEPEAPPRTSGSWSPSGDTEL